MSDDKIIAEHAAAISGLRQESSDLKSNAILMSSVGSITLAGGLVPNFVKPPPKWMTYASIVSGIVSIIAFSKSVYDNIKTRTIDHTIDKVSPSDHSHKSISDYSFTPTDQAGKDQWEERVKKTAKTTAEIQR